MKEMKLNRKTRYTRMVLRDSLVELMKVKPIRRITIKELCENADINRSTFYAHYTDQYDLLRRIEDDTLQWLKEAVIEIAGKSEKDEMMPVLEGICEYFADNNQHLQVLMSEQGDFDFQKEVFTLIYRLCGISSPEARADFEEDFLVFVVNGSVGLLQHWAKTNSPKTAKEMAEVIYNLASPIRKTAKSGEMKMK